MSSAKYLYGASEKDNFPTGIQVAVRNYQDVVPNCKTQTENFGKDNERPHTLENYSCSCVWLSSENNSTFSTVFTHVSVGVDKHENPFIDKGTVWSILDNVSFMVPRRLFFGPQSHPTDSATSLIGHIHLKWTDHGRYCTGFRCVSRNGAGSQKREHTRNIKER